MALACCAVEVAAALPETSEGLVDAHVLVVSGTITRGALPTILRRYDALPEPRRVVAFGACATSGGPYWDSYAALPGIADHLPVDIVVPGCPPRPSMLDVALRELATRWDTGVSSGAAAP
jgi:NADH-quinone oxidoreductase subunit B